MNQLTKTMKKYLLYVIALSLIFPSCSNSSYLKDSNSKLSELTDQKLIKFNYQEELKVLGHNFEPWGTSNYIGFGEFWVNQHTFLKQDTLLNSRGTKYYSKIDYHKETLLFQDYGDTNLFAMSEDFYNRKLINTARYTPTILLAHFIDHKAKMEVTANSAVYTTQMGAYTVKLFFNTTTNLIDKITYLNYDELYGDVTTSFNYSAYQTKAGVSYPSTITIEKINGKVVEHIRVTANEMVVDNFQLLQKPAVYEFIEPKEETKPELKVTKYNDFIHFIDLVHTDDKVMVVEIDDYVLVAEAPINAKNGELIIAEVKKIAPNKPIKYFVFGHHHPHYLGGLRAFVNQDATILCTSFSKNYVEYIANASHSLQPDKLFLNPKPLKTQIVTDSLVLGNNQEMIIYFMGEKSDHTIDYMIYYFPKEKLLFQDDLCWIPKEGALTKARARQAGLYYTIQELNLEVETIIQSWPVTSHRVKTVFPFSELEKSVQLEK